MQSGGLGTHESFVALIESVKSFSSKPALAEPAMEQPSQLLGKQVRKVFEVIST